MNRSRVAVWAGGTPTGGGSGFENYVRAINAGTLQVDIAVVVSNHEHGGVRERADRLGVPFHHFAGPFPKWNEADTVGGRMLQAEVDRTALELAVRYDVMWHLFSGWLKRITSLPVERTISIHPALFSALGGRFCGNGMHGGHLQQMVQAALDAGELGEHPASGFTMHFVGDVYDDPSLMFAEVRVPLMEGMSSDEIYRAVNAAEHAWQPYFTNLVVTGQIRLEQGVVHVPEEYGFLPKK